MRKAKEMEDRPRHRLPSNFLDPYCAEARETGQRLSQTEVRESNLLILEEIAEPVLSEAKGPALRAPRNDI